MGKTDKPSQESGICALAPRCPMGRSLLLDINSQSGLAPEKKTPARLQSLTLMHKWPRAPD